jgi:ABC-type transport system involved in multi-copper enzyme maturation permease subunit
MNKFYLFKCLKDQRGIIIALFCFHFAFQFLYAWMLLDTGMDKLAEQLPSFMMRMLGLEVGTVYFKQQMLAFSFAHPLILIGLSLLPLSIPARYMTGEVETKTFDLLLVTGIHRSVVVSHLFVLILLVLILLVGAMFGATVWINQIYQLNMKLGHLTTTSLCAFLFFLNMGSIGLALAGFYSERGKMLSHTLAIFITLYFFDTIIRISDKTVFLLNYSYFQLFQPSKLILGQMNALVIVAVDLIIIVVMLMTAFLQFNRRDI